jgi:3-dehydroquinate dehydratase / shikimate dehydrogenase
MKLCLSILPHTFEELYAMLSREECTQCDVLEIRCDGMTVSQWHAIDIASVKTLITCPIIITVRSHAEGGLLALSPQDRIEIYRLWMIAGCAWIDVEFANMNVILPALPLSDETKLMLSYHTSIADTFRLNTTLKDMLAEKPDCVKLIFTAHTIEDGVKIQSLMNVCKQQGVAFVIHAMGKAGTPSRFLGAIQGNAWTYCALDVDAQTASGQITLRTARSVYRLHEITEKSTKKDTVSLFGLLANPTAHSKGIYLHNALLRRYGKQAVYINFTAPNADAFLNVWQPLVQGISISIPHKEMIIEHATIVEPIVYSAQAANTLIRHEQTYKAYNTDVLAVRDMLSEHLLLLDYVVVAGAGGTAKSVVTALKILGVQRIAISARNKEKAEMFAEAYSVEVYQAHNAQQPNVHAYEQPTCYINTTPIGMKGTVEEHSMPPAAESLRPGMLVFDVVYNPRNTPLMIHAKELDCTALSGEEMFLRQAWYQFNLFTYLSIPYSDVVEEWQRIQPLIEEFSAHNVSNV